MKTGRITKDMKSRLKLAENMIFKLNGSQPCLKRTDKYFEVLLLLLDLDFFFSTGLCLGQL